jgi:preprotein translocase SecE subunit
MNKIITFLRETKTEMAYVQWPTKHRALIYAVSVLVFSLGLGYALGGFDTLLQMGLQKILY